MFSVFILLSVLNGAPGLSQGLSFAMIQERCRELQFFLFDRDRAEHSAPSAVRPKLALLFVRSRYCGVSLVASGI